MLEQRLIYRGGGTYQTATRFDLAQAEQAFKPGDECAAKISQRRSAKQNAYFHCLIQNAWASQQAGPPQPTWEHLKAHVLNAIGHCDVKRFQPEAMTREAAEIFRSAFYVEFFANRRTGEIVMKKPRQTRGLSTEEMSELIEKAIDYICREIVPGTEPEDMRAMAKQIKEAKKKAA